MGLILIYSPFLTLTYCTPQTQQEEFVLGRKVLLQAREVWKLKNAGGLLPPPPLVNHMTSSFTCILTHYVPLPPPIPEKFLVVSTTRASIKPCLLFTDLVRNDRYYLPPPKMNEICCCLVVYLDDLSYQERKLIDAAKEWRENWLAQLEKKVTLHIQTVEQAEKAAALVPSFLEALRIKQELTARCEYLVARLRELKVRLTYLEAKLYGLSELESKIETKKRKLAANESISEKFEIRLRQCLSLQRKTLESFLR